MASYFISPGAAAGFARSLVISMATREPKCHIQHEWKGGRSGEGNHSGALSQNINLGFSSRVRCYSVEQSRVTFLGSGDLTLWL